MKKTELKEIDNRADLTLDALVDFALKNRPKLSHKDAFKYMTEMHEQKKVVTMLFKVPNKEYQQWYDQKKQYLGTTIEDETTYIVSNQNKAFGNYGGYSIFAKSIGSYKRGDKWLDRIENLPIEYAIKFFDEDETLIKEIIEKLHH